MAVYPQGPAHGFDNVSYCSIITLSYHHFHFVFLMDMRWGTIDNLTYYHLTAAAQSQKQAIAYFKSKQTLPPFGFADQNRG